jgi:hypothetical protein
MTAFFKFAFIATFIFALGMVHPASAKGGGGGNATSTSSHASTVSQAGQKQKTNIRKSGGNSGTSGKPYLYYQFR